MRFIKRKTSDYTQAEIERFNKMHEILTTYNKFIATKNELPLPGYSYDEMAQYSAYREILQNERAKDWLIINES